jgi:signal transduction histidine kinase
VDWEWILSVGFFISIVTSQTLNMKEKKRNKIIKKRGD